MWQILFHICVQKLHSHNSERIIKIPDPAGGALHLRGLLLREWREEKGGKGREREVEGMGREGRGRGGGAIQFLAFGRHRLSYATGPIILKIEIHRNP